jgi:NAD(P)-dependent dehydrogenase (short-subunit alcohol dehydrogenase family)
VIDVFDSFRLDGLVAIVTGASSGLGDRFARVLHAAGAAVVVAARRLERLDALAADLGAGVHPVRCDVTSEDDRRRLVDAALDRCGRLDVLVNNAGTTRVANAEDEPLDGIRKVIETNLTAAFRLCQLALPALRESGGRVVNVTSVLAHRSVDRYALGSYAASKAGLAGLTRELAAQWGRHGVRVNAIGPGWFPSGMNAMLRDPEQVAWIERHAALGRHGAEHELDGALLFLASDASSYVTGQTLLVDGGWTAF